MAIIKINYETSLSLWIILLTFSNVFTSSSEQKDSTNNNSIHSIIKYCSNYFTPSNFPNLSPYIKFSTPSSSGSSCSSKTCPTKYTEACIKLMKAIPWSEAKSTYAFQRQLFNEIFNATGFEIHAAQAKANAKGNHGEKNETLRKVVAYAGGWSTEPISSTKSKSSTTITAEHDTKKSRILTKAWQKYNHMPNSSILGNKASQWSLCSNLSFTFTETPFCLQSYILPKQMSEFTSVWHSEFGRSNKWILKPSVGTISRGVTMITDLSQIRQAMSASPSFKKSSWIIQKYLANPYLIRNKTFEVRALVLVTTVLPLRAYISYTTGVKLGFTNFSMDPTSLHDRCIHLHDKKACSHVHQDFDEYFISTNDLFKTYFTPAQVQLMKARIEEICSTMLLRVSGAWWDSSYSTLFNRYNVYELYSFDFLFDQHLNVYLNEINSRPGYQTYGKSPEGYAEHAASYVELLNIVGYQIPPLNELEPILAEFEGNHSITFNESLYAFDNYLSSSELNKQIVFARKCNNIRYNNGNVSTDQICYVDIFNSILEDLTPDDVRLLLILQDELSRVGTLFKKLIPGINELDFQLGKDAAQISKYYIDLVDGNTQALYYMILSEAWVYKYGKTRADVQIGIERLKKAIY